MNVYTLVDLDRRKKKCQKIKMQIQECNWYAYCEQQCMRGTKIFVQEIKSLIMLKAVDVFLLQEVTKWKL